MLEKLFSSKARIEILKLFLFNSENRFYQREISKLTNIPIRGVQRELKNLKEIGIIEKSVQGNRIYYKSNKECPIFQDIKRIFFKTTGIAPILKHTLEGTDLIKLAFIFGSYAKDKENLSSDIDLLIVGNITSKGISTILSKPKTELKREINYIVYKLAEFKKKIKEKNHFLISILSEKKIFIIGNEDELKKIIESG